MGFINRLTNCLRNAKKKSRRPSVAIGLLVATTISATVAASALHRVPPTVFNGSNREDHANDDTTPNGQRNDGSDLHGSNSLPNTTPSIYTPSNRSSTRDHEISSGHTHDHSSDVVAPHLGPNVLENDIRVVPIQDISLVTQDNLSNSLLSTLDGLTGLGTPVRAPPGCILLPGQTVDLTSKASSLPVPDVANEHDNIPAPATSEPGDTDSDSDRLNHVEPLHFQNHTFTISCQIGQGSFGFVWQAFDESDNEVAIKVLHKRKLFVKSFKHYKYSPEFVNKACARIVADEVNALMRATRSGCPFLTPLLCSFADDDNIYLVMRMYSASLRDFVTRRFDVHPIKMLSFNLSLTRLWAAEILLGIQTMHKMRIMHRDLKLDNILITPAGHVAVADFGLAALDQDSVRNTCCGTPGHYAPEQHPLLYTNGYDYKIDIYAYGLILLEMFVGTQWYCKIRNYDPDDCLPYDPRIQEVIAVVYNKEARLLISQLLSEDPLCRPDPEQIKKLSFFKGLNWDAVARRLYTPHFTPCASKSKPRSATSGIYSFKRGCFSTERDHVQKLIDHSTQNNEDLGALNVDFVCDDGVWLDPFHGVTCTWPRPRLGMKRLCRYYPFRSMCIQNHF